LTVSDEAVQKRAGPYNQLVGELLPEMRKEAVILAIDNWLTGPDFDVVYSWVH